MKPANFFLSLLLSSFFLISVPASARRQIPEPEDRWAQGDDIDFDNGPMEPHFVDRFMNRIEERNPELAEDLSILRREDPEAFHERVRELAKRSRIKGRDRMGRKKMNPNHRRHGKGDNLMPGRRNTEPGRGWLVRRWDEFKDWFQDNYPSHAEELEQMQQEDPEAALRELKLVYRKYRPIMRAEEENPELAEILKDDLELKNHRNELLTEIRLAQGREKEQLTEQLQEIVSERFDLIVRKKELQYQDLRERLEDLKAELAKREAEVEKMESKKGQAVKQRIEELIGKTESINWD
jgi:hypothetical protein